MKKWVFFIIFRFGMMFLTVSCLVLILSLAPDVQRYLYAVLPKGYFAEFIPPLVVLTLMCLSGWPWYWAWQQPMSRIERMLAESQPGPRPFEDTGEGMEI